MAGEWTTATIEEVAERVSMGPFGSSIKVSTFVENGIPVISGQHLHGSCLEDHEYKFITEEHAQVLKNANVRKGDVVFTHAGNIGQVAYIPPTSKYDRYVISQRQFYMRCNLAKVIPEYIVYFFRSPEGQHKLLANTSQTGVPSIAQPVTYLRTIRIPLPPLAEQKAIASVLGALDDKIKLNRRMNETLEATARALFQSWFVDFDPVRAKLNGSPPSALDAAIAALFPPDFEDTAIGHAPIGWDVKPLSELCQLGRGASPRPINDYMNGEVPWVKIADATSAAGPFLFETREMVKKEGAEKSVAVAPGDLILSNSATCGIPMFVELHGCIHDGWLYFKNLRSISKLYLFHVLIELAEHLVHIADGSVQKNLNTNLVGQQNVLVPPKEIVDAFDAHASVWFAKMRLNSLESRTLATLRDTLLPKLMSGELRIHNADKFLTEVTT
ncbi:MAG: restriction endonuclease subunit S [Ignavibacteriae bacterium]|nr:restriction endonuclease subunit S [Ignavibacteriota bacterium]